MSTRAPNILNAIASTSRHATVAPRCQAKRRVHDFVRGVTPQGGTYKVPLNSKKIVGIYSSRGNREYQEDAYAVHALQIPPKELKKSLKSSGHDWDPSLSAPNRANGKAKADDDFLAGQVAFFGIYDGHGGRQVSKYVHEHLHELIESVEPSTVQSVVNWTIKLGGYFRRFRGASLSRFMPQTHQHSRPKAATASSSSTSTTPSASASAPTTAPASSSKAKTPTTEKGPEEKIDRVDPKFSKPLRSEEPEGVSAEEISKQNGFTLEDRLTLAFLTADKEILSNVDAKRCGSTASVALIHSLDEPAQPFWAAKRLSITVGHCGDTRILLCHKPSGKVEPLTEKHHAETRVEAARLRRLGGRLVADSFGESRWMGAIENTRGFGDGEWKPSGVTAEPEVTSHVLNGEDYAYMILVTDGLTSLMSNQEIIDLGRDAMDPTRAAATIVHFAEDLGAQDNCTCIVVPLAGWGKVGGNDDTEARREYRRQQAGMLSTRMQRM